MSAVALERPATVPPSWFGHFQPAGLVALCPLLAKSTSLLSALAISAAFALTLCGSAFSISLCRRLIGPHSQVVCMLLIGATWATVADLVLQACAYPMRDGLGIYVPLIAGNCLLLMHLEARALVDAPGAALRGAWAVALSAAMLVIAAGTIRELAAAGQLLSDAPLMGWHAPIGTLNPVKLPLLASAAGAFLVLSILIAAANRLWPDRRVD